ncbi:MAG: dihydrofolate reductase [Acidobacteria bacterium]|nr:dihydrofolate reductase [Acidobacteriota bacterium]
MITAIVAIARNFAIGRDGKLPWHYSADLKFFKRTTSGHTVVMGFNTWKSIGKPLPNRLNIVLSRTRTTEPQPGLKLVRSVDEVIALADADDLFLIGGAQVYREFADVIDRWIVTEIPETVENADAFMPKDFLDGFALVDSEDLGDGLTVRVYERRQNDV